MLALISPAKNLDFDTPAHVKEFTQPDFQEESEYLINKLRKVSRKKISAMMNISPALSDLNFERYQEWTLPMDASNAKQAALAFNGEVYWGLEAKTLSEQQLNYAQDHLRILSGLHGLLKPLDLIQPYRLEMGSRFAVTPKTKNLYLYWGNKITKKLKSAVENSGNDLLINLASNEYFKSVQPDDLGAHIVTPQFKDWKNGEYKALMAYAKRARGMMAKFIVEKEVQGLDELKTFDYGGYAYNEKLSKGDDWVFTRDKMPA